MGTTSKKCLCVCALQEMFVDKSVMFGSYLRPGLKGQECVYEEVTNQAKLVNVLEGYLQDLNSAPGAAAMNLGNPFFSMSMFQYIYSCIYLFCPLGGNHFMAAQKCF